MNLLFPIDKDHIINAMDEDYELSLTDEEYKRLRRLTSSELFLVTMLLSHAAKACKKE